MRHEPRRLLIFELNDIWRYLAIIWRYLTTERFTLEPENYRPKDIVKYRHLSPNGNRALGVLGPGSYLEILGSQVPGPTWPYWNSCAPGPTSGSRVSLFWYATNHIHFFRYLQLKKLWSQDHVISRDKLDKICGTNILKSVHLYTVISLEAATIGVVYGLQRYLKRVSGIIVFLWILRNV